MQPVRSNRIGKNSSDFLIDGSHLNEIKLGLACYECLRWGSHPESSPPSNRRPAALTSTIRSMKTSNQASSAYLRFGHVAIATKEGHDRGLAWHPFKTKWRSTSSPDAYKRQAGDHNESKEGQKAKSAALSFPNCNETEMVSTGTPTYNVQLGKSAKYGVFFGSRRGCENSPATGRLLSGLWRPDCVWAQWQ
jgi:hypothetical protein